MNLEIKRNQAKQQALKVADAYVFVRWVDQYEFIESNDLIPVWFEGEGYYYIEPGLKPYLVWKEGMTKCNINF